MSAKQQLLQKKSKRSERKKKSASALFSPSRRWSWTILDVKFYNRRARLDILRLALYFYKSFFSIFRS